MGDKIFCPFCKTEIPTNGVAFPGGSYALVTCPACCNPWVLLRSVSYRIFKIEEVEKGGTP